MKQLILVRHGKSSWEYDVSDIERPLKKRGINDATRVSMAFKHEAFSIDAIFSSPANRALSTCKIFVKNIDIETSRIEIIEQLYDFSGNDVLNFLKSLNDTLSTVIIFGHNHAFTAITNTFGDRYIDNLPTAGLVAITFNVDQWKHITLGQTTHIMLPRDYK